MNPSPLSQDTQTISKQSLNWFQSNRFKEVPSTIWILGLVSMLMNISSVIISSLSPLFMMNVLMASATVVGLIRGITEGIAYFTKIFSGVLSDYIGKRKTLILIGYGFGAFTKPIFATTVSIWWYATAQLLDRVSNGMRDSPRDALIADTAPLHMKGRCFGLRQSFATAGACLGAIIATIAMIRTSNNYQFIYWISLIPVILAVILLFVGIQEPKNIPRRKDYTKNLISFKELKNLGPTYWYFMLITTVFMLSRFSEAFLVMRAKSLKMDDSYAPMVMLVMNLSYTFSGNIIASIMDKVDRRIFLWISFPTLILSYLLMGLTESLTVAMVGVGVYGLHMGASQGVLYTMVADVTPKDLRATSFGIFSLICGIALMISSSFAGYLSDQYGIAVTFLAGGGVAFIATLLLFFMHATNEPQTSDKTV